LYPAKGVHDDLWSYFYGMPDNITCWQFDPNDKEVWRIIHVVSLHNGEAPFSYAEMDQIRFETYEQFKESRKIARSLEAWKAIQNGVR